MRFLMTTGNPDTIAAVKRGGMADVLAWLLSFAAFLPGCSVGKEINPSFPLTVKQAKSDLMLMRDDPVGLQRPLVVLGGWGDVTGLPPAHIAKQLRQATGDDRVISIGFAMCNTFDACRARVLRRVAEAFPDGQGGAVEVDVVGFSMGGLVARYSAIPANDEDVVPPLRITRLYTISTPHRGAVLAQAIAPGPLATDMRAGSAFLEQLDDALASANYPVFPYVRLGDAIVGPVRSAPHNQTPWWLPARPFSSSHIDAYRDPRLIAELARRLRGETPYTTEPAGPVPENAD